MIGFALAIAAQQMSDVRLAYGPFRRGEWRGDCVRGGDSPLAETCRATRAGAVTVRVVRSAFQTEVSARPKGCRRRLAPVVIPGELEGMRRSVVIDEAVDKAARAAIRACGSRAKLPVLDGGDLFDMLAATDGLIVSDE